MKSGDIKEGGTYMFVATDALNRKHLEGDLFTVVEIKSVWRINYKKHHKVKRFFNADGIGARAEELEPWDDSDSETELPRQIIEDPF